MDVLTSPLTIAMLLTILLADNIKYLGRVGRGAARHSLMKASGIIEIVANCVLIFYSGILILPIAYVAKLIFRYLGSLLPTYVFLKAGYLPNDVSYFTFLNIVLFPRIYKSDNDSKIKASIIKKYGYDEKTTETYMSEIKGFFPPNVAYKILNNKYLLNRYLTQRHSKSQVHALDIDVFFTQEMEEWAIENERRVQDFINGGWRNIK